MASRTVDRKSQAGNRICDAFACNAIQWEDGARERALRESDASAFTLDDINRRACRHVLRHGEIREQDNPSDGQHDFAIWYSIEFPIRGRLYFFKFVLDPDEELDEDRGRGPGIFVISFHLAGR